MRSEAELAEIVEQLTEHQDSEDKQLECAATVPHMILNPVEHARRFYNENGRCGVWGVVSGVWSVGSGIWGVGCGVWVCEVLSYYPLAGRIFNPAQQHKAHMLVMPNIWTGKTLT